MKVEGGVGGMEAGTGGGGGGGWQGSHNRYFAFSLPFVNSSETSGHHLTLEKTS